MLISDLLSRQPATSHYFPRLSRHVSPRVISIENDRLLLVIKIVGMPFESIDNDMIVNRFDARNRLFASVAKEKGARLAIWTTLNRRETTFSTEYSFPSRFAATFAEKYLQRFTNGHHYANTFYISLILKMDDLKEGISELEELGQRFVNSLGAYDPEILEVYEENSCLFSQAYEFIGELINGVAQKIPLLASPANETVTTSTLHFGYDVLEIRGDNFTKFATCYDLKDFPDTTVWGQFDALLTTDAEFTLTQSWVCMPPFEAQKSIKSQINKLKSAGDQAEHQIDELEGAVGYISSGELAFGEYAAALVVYGADARQAVKKGGIVSTHFLNFTAAQFLRATLSAPITFISQVPGAKEKARPMPKSSRNLAAVFGMHNYSTGKAQGNPIGDGSALMPVQTRSKAMYSLNCHYTKQKQNNHGDKIAGSTLLLGMTGTGKTTVLNALLTFASRFHPKIFAIDKDASLKIFFAAIGGTYFSLKPNEPTGLAPFQLEKTAQNLSFLYQLVKACAGGVEVTTDEESARIKIAVDTVYELDREHRRFSRLLDSIPRGSSLRKRLAKWCWSEKGEFHWALDNVQNGFHDITQYQMIGFDVTHFLRVGYEPTEPILAYLLHLKSLMQEDGKLMATVVEEFWLPVKYPTTRHMILDALTTGRKKGEFVLLVSQSPEHALTSAISDELVTQTATKIFLPNPAAKYASYERFMEKKEFTEYKNLDVDSRTFLIKQGNQSAFATLDLYGMEDEIAVLSSDMENVKIMDKVIDEVGTDPDVWLPVFHERRMGKKTIRIENQKSEEGVTNAI